MPGRLKMLLELKNPFYFLLRAQSNVHYFSINLSAWPGWPGLPGHDSANRQLTKTRPGEGVSGKGDVVPLAYLPWHLLYFLPDPHQQGSLRPSLAAPASPTAPAAAPTGATRRGFGAPFRPDLPSPSSSPGPLSSTLRPPGCGLGRRALRGLGSSGVQVVGQGLAAALHHLFRNLRSGRDR